MTTTAFRAAFEKAGLDTVAAELAKLTAEALRLHGNDPTKALPKFKRVVRKREDLLDVLLLEHLRRAVQAAATAPTTTLPEPAPDKRPFSVKVGEHRRRHQRSEEERAAELVAAANQSEILRSVFEFPVNDRAIGDFAWGELSLAVRDNAYNAASFLRQGTEATAAAILLDKIHAHARVDDHSKLVRQILTAKTLQGYIDEARAEAPKKIEDGMRQYAASLESASAQMEALR